MVKYRSFTDEIRRAVRSCGISRYRLSKLIDVSQPALSRFVNGKSGIASDSLDAIAKVLGFKLVVNGSATTRRLAASRSRPRRS